MVCLITRRCKMTTLRICMRSQKVMLTIVFTVVLFNPLAHATSNLTYECYPNATLKIENPSDYTMVFANNSQTVCTTTWVPGNTAVYVDNCEIEDQIFIVFSYLPVSFMHIVGGGDFEVYVINCIEIPVSGVFKQTGVSFGATPKVPAATEYTVISVDSGIYEDPLGLVLKTETHVGIPLFWIMTSPQSKIRFRPVDCWAYAGKVINETAPKKKILENGCSLDERLVTNFLLWLSPGHGTLARTAILYAFRFYISEYITFKCKVRLCLYDAAQGPVTFCDTDECETGKKRRYIYDVADDNGENDEHIIKTLRVRIPALSDGTNLGVSLAWLPLGWLLWKICS